MIINIALRILFSALMMTSSQVWQLWMIHADSPPRSELLEQDLGVRQTVYPSDDLVEVAVVEEDAGVTAVVNVRAGQNEVAVALEKVHAVSAFADQHIPDRGLHGAQQFHCLPG